MVSKRLLSVILSCLLFCFFSINAAAQNTVITGRVTDPDGKPVENVSVQLKGTATGAATAADGTYRLTVPKATGNVLVFSSVGFTEKEITQTAGTVNVQMEKNSQSLDAVVVVGYGTQKRKDVTGSVVSLDKQRLESLPNTNFAQALEGALPGVSINTNGGGAEGNSVSILVRGRKSVLANTNPIIILDGVPYNGSISDINPTDIASFDILKDASAAAIYGSRAANGVILITTKRGTSGKPVITYDGFTGTQEVGNLPPVLQGEDFYNFKVTREGLGSITLSEKANYDAKRFTNWLDLGTRKGMRQQHTVSARGGSNNFKYYASLSYLNVKGVAVNDNFKRFSARINLEANFTGWLTYGTNTQLSYNDRSGIPVAFSGDYGVYTFNPLTTPYDSAGNLTIYPWAEDKYFANPLAPTLASSLDNTYKALTTNYFVVKLPFVPGLSYRLNTGIDYQGRTINTYYGRNTRTGAQAAGSLTQSNSIVRNLTLENILNYDRSFGKHTVGFTGVYGYEYRNTSTNSLSAEGFPSDVLTFYQANVALLKEPRTTFSREDLISQMGRINYNYDSRYLLTATVRRDGYSGFGENDKYGVFPGAALAWNISNESFFPKAFVNNLKLRLSYGAVGNQGVTAYQTLARLSTRSYVDGATTAAGYVPTSLGNPDLGWEKSTQKNIGLDFSLLNNRIAGTLDYYHTENSDLLLTRSISSVQGVTSVTQNIGKTSNKGLEFAVNTVNIRKKDFTWSSSGNISFNRNKFVDIYGDGKSDTASKYFIGHPIDVDFGYVFNGVWQIKEDTLNTPQGAVKPGYAKIKDVNGDGVINAFDRTILSNNQPSFTWGLSNTFKYKNWNLYVFVHGVQGRTNVNSLLSDNNVNSGVRYTTVVKNWWTPNNPTNDFYANVLNATKGFAVPLVENSSFIRVKDILLSYSFSAAMLSRTKLSNFKVFVETRNPFTITKWSGLDPEFTSQTTIPMQKEYIVGVSVGL